MQESRQSISDAADEARSLVARLQDTLFSFWDALQAWGATNGQAMAIAGGVGLGIFLLAWIARRVVLIATRKRRTASRIGWAYIFGRFVESMNPLFLLVASVYAGLTIADAPESVRGGVRGAFIILLAIQLAVWVRTVLRALLARRAASRREGASALVSALSVVGWVIDVIVWSIALLFVLDNLGINITAIVAGLGVGGVAIALVAQGAFTDIFAAFSIVFDRPFDRGDFVAFDDVKGTVEKIGLKTTRFRALSGEQVIISNAQLLSKQIHNYQRAEQRRVHQRLGVPYQTPSETLKQIPERIADIFEGREDATLEWIHLHDFGASAFEFDFAYYVRTQSYKEMLKVREMINIEVVQAFEELRAEFAYPTRTIHLANSSGEMIDPSQSGGAIDTS